MQRVAVHLRSVVALVGAAAVAGGVLVPTVASAHTDLEYTLPADGEEVAQPVEEITVAFDDPVTLVGAGFEVLTPAGDIVVPSVSSEDGAVYLLDVPTPLAGGQAAVRYEVAAADGHVLEGGISFTVTAAPVTTAPATRAPTVPPAATEPVTSVTGAPATTTAATTTAPSVIATATTASPATASPATTAPAVAADDGGGSGTWIVVAIVAAIVLGGAAFVILRARRGTPT